MHIFTPGSSHNTNNFFQVQGNNCIDYDRRHCQYKFCIHRCFEKTKNFFQVEWKNFIYCSKRHGQYTFCIHCSSDNISHFFKLNGKSASTAGSRTVNTHFVYIVPLITPVTYFGLKICIYCSSAVGGTVCHTVKTRV